MEIENLNRLLNDEDVEVRRSAIESLRGMSGEACIRMLLHALEDVSWRVRNTAKDILIEEHPVDEFIGGLIRLLYIDDNAGARNSAIEALIRLNRKATPFLIEAFKTPNRDVRKFIIDVLGAYEDERSLPLMLMRLTHKANLAGYGGEPQRLIAESFAKSWAMSLRPLLPIMPALIGAASRCARPLARLLSCRIMRKDFFFSI